MRPRTADWLVGGWLAWKLYVLTGLASLDIGKLWGSSRDHVSFDTPPELMLKS
jgi:hypothetical protein